MYYSELSTTSNKPSVLSTSVQTGASKTAGAATGKDVAKTTDKDADKATSSPAYTISQSMESLLDSMTGKGKAAGASGGAGAGTGAAAGGNGGLDRAKQAQSLMQSALDHGNSLFGKAIDGMKQGLGDALSALGVPKNRIDDAVSGFGDNLKSKMANLDFSQLGVDVQASQSQWSIESQGIELEIQDGDRSVRISFAKSTLDFRRDDQRLQASLGQGGDMALGLSGATTTVNGKSTGMIVRSNGFSDDEIKNILGKLNDMASKGSGGDGMKGLAVLKPTSGKDGITRLSLDLSVPVEGLSSGSAATAASANAGAKATGVDLKA